MPPKKGRGNPNGRSGKPNYDRESVLEAIRRVRPKSALGWKKTADAYMELTGEVMPRDPSDLKRHFVKKLCQNLRKVTGESGPSRAVAEAQVLYRALENDCEVDVLGEEEDDDSEDDELAGMTTADFFPSNVNSSSEPQPAAVAAPNDGAATSLVPNTPANLGKRTREAAAPSFGAATVVEEPRTKSSRNAGRYSAALALNNLAETIGANSSSSSMVTMMQSQMQMQRETMQQMMQIMMLFMTIARTPPPTPGENKHSDEN